MKFFIMFLINSVYANEQATHSSDGTALSIFFIFFFLGIGSFLKEINKKLGVSNVNLHRYHSHLCYLCWDCFLDSIGINWV